MQREPPLDLAEVRSGRTMPIIISSVPVSCGVGSQPTSNTRRGPPPIAATAASRLMNSSSDRTSPFYLDPHAV
jgi:hypothetical protein